MTEVETKKKEFWKALKEAKRFLDVMWHTSNFWGRIFIFLIVSYPMLAMSVRVMGGSIAVAASLAFMPFLALVIALSIVPVITVVAAEMKWSGNIVTWIIAVVGFDLVIGGAFAAVPLANDSGLVPILLVVVAAIVTLKIAGIKTIFIPLLWIALLALVIIFVLGGRNKISSTMATTPQKQNFQQGAYHVEDGLRIQPCTLERAKPVIVPPIPTYIQKIPGTPITKAVVNCREYQEIGDIGPHETIDIRHISYGIEREKGNRCSYNICGDSYPVGGTPGAITRAQFTNDMAFEAFSSDKVVKHLGKTAPAGAMMFWVVDTKGKVTGFGVMGGPGGILKLANISTLPGTVYMAPNYQRSYYEDPEYKWQIGADGSTATFEIRNERGHDALL